MARSRDLADSGVVINALDSVTSNVQDQLDGKQTYDANLTSFVTTFTLPIIDGSNGQVLSTDGAGSLSFVDGSDPNALTSSDIGVTVQDYDLNLTDFVTTFTLPIIDGTAGQVLATDGAGTLYFVDVSTSPSPSPSPSSYVFQGSTSGYVSGGFTYSPTFQATNNIFKFSFASSPTTSSDVGDLSVTRYYASGNNSKENSYASGGRAPSLSPNYSNVIDKFPFASDGNATDVGNLTRLMEAGAGQSSETNGYQSGGAPSTIDIQKFPFAADTNATDVADLSPTARGYASAQSSLTHGYISGGGNPGNINIIEKFPFATDTNATDVGNLATTLGAAAGQSSDTNGYSSGGILGPGTASNVIQKFPFATDANATDVGDLVFSRVAVSGQSSTTKGYTSGGYFSLGSASNVIQSVPFSSDTNATSEGALTTTKAATAGTHI